MSSGIDPQENEIISALKKLQATPPRNEEAASEGRTNFLSQVETVASNHISGQLSRKTQRSPILLRVSQALLAALVALVILLSGTGLTAYAAQGALPGDQLYGLKIWIEDTRLFFAVNPHQSFDLHLEFANNRLDELVILLQNNQDLNSTKLDFEDHYHSAEALSGEVEEEDLQELEVIHQKYLTLFPDNKDQPGSETKDSQENPQLEEDIKDSTINDPEDKPENEDEGENGTEFENSEGKEGEHEEGSGGQKETEEPDEPDDGDHNDDNEKETDQPTNDNEHDEED